MTDDLQQARDLWAGIRNAVLILIVGGFFGYALAEFFA